MFIHTSYFKLHTSYFKTMTPFLDSIAQAYTSQRRDLSKYLFVFPGRRAGTFFLKYLIEANGNKDFVLPKVLTMSDFVERISGRIVAGRIELLFILYQAYSDILKENGAKVVPEFDVFRRWGETVLSDFNEVDMQDVDAESLFKNVKDLREISSNFLTEEQLKVMNEFFGQSFDTDHLAEDFWKRFNDTEDGVLQSKFRLLWQVLSPLYDKFHDMLESKGLTSSGGAYRLAADILEDDWPSDFMVDRVVMVGFNALTSSERRIFDALSKMVDDDEMPFADFFWDATGPVISDKLSSAGRYVNFNMRRWPMPEWALRFISQSDTKELPGDIRVISVPSNSMQTKVVSEILSEMAIQDSDFDNAKVAVVLPDEALLMPMLYSIPEKISDVNLTMGYPLRLSSAYSFVSLLRRLQTDQKKSGSVVGYYYKDLNMLLSHPFSRVLFEGEAVKVMEWVRSHHRYVVDMAEIRDISPLMTKLLRPLGDGDDVQTTALWLDNILQSVAEAMDRKNTKSSKRNVDVINIDTYRAAISQMLQVVEEYQMQMNWRTFLVLTERLVSGETVNFHGKPLKGLQVMGILETRCLDFDRIIIPSLNERILPARHRARTFISDSLRKAYGLPPVSYSESLFAYYFFRMISRSKEVVLLYDSRSSEGVKSGDVSRYVLQLQYLYARNNLKMQTRVFDISKSELHPSPIRKTEEMMSVIDAYLDVSSSGKNLSATALTKYANCQIKFYFENILKIKTDVESSEFIDAMTQGDVVHDVMEAIYLPENKRHVYLQHPEVIDKKLIEARIRDKKSIDTMIRRSINTRFYHLPEEMVDRPLRGSSLQVAKVLRNQILDILKFDLRQAPFLLFGVEISGNVFIRLRDGRLVNMRYAIDRLDSCLRMNDGREEELIRIVDYKTGKIHNEATSMQAVFDGEYQSKNLLQLWLYANLFDALPNKNFDSNGPRPVIDLFGENSNLPNDRLVLELYEVCKVSEGTHNYPKVDNKVQKDHCDLNSEFLQLLESMLNELFDPNEPFKPALDEKICKYCPFKTICWR